MMKSLTLSSWYVLLIVIQISCSSSKVPTEPSQPTEEASQNHESQSERQTNAVRPLWTVNEPDPSAPNTALETDLYAEEAPEFPDDLVWLNSDQHPPLKLADLRGQVVILMFWSYDCIDCFYNFQDLQRLQTEHPADLTIISIHSTKLESEDDMARVLQTITNYQADYPTIDDQDQRMWYKWGAQGIPTFVVIDPVGAIYGIHNGENVYGAFKPILKLITR